MGLYPNEMKKAEMDRPECVVTIWCVLGGFSLNGCTAEQATTTFQLLWA